MSSVFSVTKVGGADLGRCAADARALLWSPDAEVAGLSAQTSGGLGPLLLLARGDGGHVRVTPPQFFGPLVAAGAVGGLLVHTHGADRPPGPEDLAVTRRLVAAGALLGIPLVAHLIIGPTRWWDAVNAAGGQHGYPVGLGVAA